MINFCVINIEMDRQTQSTKRKYAGESNETGKRITKRGKSTTKDNLSEGVQSASQRSRSLGSPRQTKTKTIATSVKTKITRKIIINKLAQSADGNNNANPHEPEPKYGAIEQTSYHKSVHGIQNCSVTDEGDEVHVGVRDSEDEFMDEDASQESAYNQDSESDVESGHESDSNESEVVISQRSKELWKQQEKAQIDAMAANPEFHEMVQSMVGEQMRRALGDPDYAVKFMDKTPNKAGGKSLNYVRKVISKAKSPSDTTIYAPALNLTPEKCKENGEIINPLNKFSDFIQEM